MVATVGQDMYDFADEVFPLCRSITGDGVRTTLKRMQREVPLKLVEVPSGTDVFDWQVPLEWNIEGAFVDAPDGRRVVDFADSNLHIASYSVPIQATMDMDELLVQTHIDERNAEWIPYRTNYHTPAWGVCLSRAVRDAMVPGKYRVSIDSRLEAGSLTYGELLIPGQSSDEILIYSHTCHPSLANDNLSGLAVTTWLAKELLGKSNKFSFRFVWGPGTIGSITWLAQNQSRLKHVRHALVCVLLGRPGQIHYKKTPSGSCDIDNLITSVLSKRRDPAVILDFEPYGYDERQFSSPGISIPTGRLSRLPNDAYSEYHSSADDMSLIESDTLEDSLQCLSVICEQLDESTYYVSTAPRGEPQLGKRGLYGTTGGMSPKDRQIIMLWLLNRSNGQNSLQNIARRAGFDFAQVRSVAEELEEAGLLRSPGAILRREMQ